jgi:hypothetical protein
LKEKHNKKNQTFPKKNCVLFRQPNAKKEKKKAYKAYRHTNRVQPNNKNKNS